MSKKMSKRVLALLLVSIMAFSAIGCAKKETGDSQQTVTPGTKEQVDQKGEENKENETETSETGDPNVNKTGYPIVKEPITITVAGLNGNTPDWNDTDMVKEIEKRFGIKLECTSYESDAWETQLALMMSSGEMPDLLIGVNQSIDKMNEYGKDGFFLPINEYLEYAPALAQYFEAYPMYKATLTDMDGNIYGLSKINLNDLARVTRTWINREWLARVGKEQPASVDELYDVLKAFKEQDANGNGDPNDEIPLSGASPDSLLAILSGFGIFTGNMDYALQTDSSGKVFLGQATENYKAFLKYMNKLYAEGLYDKDALIQTLDEFRAKVKEGRLGMFVDAAPFVAAGQPVSYDQNYYWVGGLTSEYNETPTVPYTSSVGSQIKIAVNADTKYPEAVVRLIDYFYTEDGVKTGSRGFEGVSWDLKDVDFLEGVQILTLRTPEGYASAEEYRYKKAIINEGFNVVGGVKDMDMGVIMSADEALLNNPKLLENYGWSVLVEQGRRGKAMVDVFPTLVYSPEEANSKTSLQTDVTLYIQQARAQFITGEIDIDSGWDNYLNTLKQMQLEELLGIEQNAYDRMMK